MPKQTILRNSLSALALLWLTTGTDPATAGLTQDIEDALNFYHYGHNGAIKFDLNYRYENANQDAGTTQTANANTARLRLGFLTPKFYDLQAYAEYEVI